MSVKQNLEDFKKNTKVEIVDFSAAKSPSATPGKGHVQGKGK